MSAALQADRAERWSSALADLLRRHPEEYPLPWALTLVACGWTLALLGTVVVRRLVYPFELEWMEGGSVDHVRRILDGHRLYVAPSLDFVPYTYTPLYFYAAALVAKVTGVGFFPLRLLSAVATAVNLGLIFSLVRRDTGRIGCGLAAAGLFAATYRLGGAWFDVCRVDAFALALALGGVHLCRTRTSLGSAAVAGILFWAAFFSKQSALGIGVAAAAGTMFLAWRRGLVALVVLASLFGASTAIMDRLHDGWYRFYVFKVPALHSLLYERVTTYFTVDWAKNAPILAVFAIAGLLSLARPDRARIFGFYASFAAGTVATVWAVWIRTGSYDNILMPGHACAAILAGIGVGYAVPTVAQRPRLLVCLALFVQLVALAWEPREQTPSRNDENLGRELIDLARRQEGDVWIVSHGWMGQLAGKPMHAQWQAMADTFLDPEVGGALRRQMLDAVAARRFGAIITDTHGRFDELLVGYHRAERVFSRDGFWPKTGWWVRPDQLWLPNPGP